MLLPRIYSNLEKYIESGKVLVIYGPRRVGKTTIVEQYLKTTQWKYKLDSGDNIRTQHTLSSQDFSQILPYVEGYELLVLDEAQNIPNVGMALKILVDQKPNLRIIATGSSSFELSGQVGEPLTGRKTTLTLYPIAQQELLQKTYNHFELKQKLPDYLIYGSYPEVITATSQKEKISILEELVNSYLLKDILTLENIKGSQTLLSILKLLAFQVGSQVSFNEIANSVNIDVKTVARYLDLLEKGFVIKSLTGYSSNLRNEVTSKAKYYFFDNGIRNGIIQQYNSLDLRMDAGQLWENFVFIERLKYRSYTNKYANMYFWRTYSQQEIDIVEEHQGKLFGYESKWSEKRQLQAPKEWKITYPNAMFSFITPKNYLEFIA
ncbi:TPA: AAA family ATPase [Patescibacteria group bacterium]|uniref:AAA ATPase n=1 Tax=Candidatus Gottesmanbacteria bacterium GW2011_GWA1_43_11 TaxID=1618436 RepID=A0A0G1CJ76_9BACT|nr:MAG: AAA ATPase [Candidatus Gottesmanbacteria bacterium GW2011_GWA1_43_11]HCS78541.1 AAA family ATPase [Patescibacteria group bacterium]